MELGKTARGVSLCFFNITTSKQAVAAGITVA